MNLTTADGAVRITWLTRSTLDYRIPVFKALDQLCGGNLSVLYSRESTPPRVQEKFTRALGERAVGLIGEKRLGPKDISDFANLQTRVVYQPGILGHTQQTAPDVLVGDGFFQWTGFALAYKLWKRVPLVVCYERTFHTERTAQWYRRAYRRAAIRFIDAMCCNGSLCVEYTCSLGMPRSRITVPNMAADTDGLGQASAAITLEQKARTRQAWNARGPVFLYVGQLIPRKGVRYLLDGWALLERAHGREGTLVLVGQGPEEAGLRQQASELGLHGVRFLGAVDYDHLARYYASADVFVIPTLEDNWSLVVPEAMACGLPILCSKYNGCWPELVQADRNGWVFDPLDARDVVRCLAWCMRNQARLAEMGQHSKEIVAGHTPQIAANSIFGAVKIALRHDNRL